MRVPPLRSLNDFLFSCYSVPDMDSVNERFTSNMLYYQTNYFLITAVLIGINLSDMVTYGSGLIVLFAFHLLSMDRISAGLFGEAKGFASVPET
ncbi:PRA1 family protein 3 [Taenia solium]|eukprot:TsM_000434400 transcript=TsM_000434400 gene=TsM_000434400